MRFDVITLFPELVQSVALGGVIGRAFEQGLLSLHCWNPRDYALDRHRTVDERPYGGGPGMVMKIQPLEDCLVAARAANPTAQVVYLSPQGRVLQQAAVQEFAAGQDLILIAGRYEGIDERFLERYVDAEWSIGDYVISGGELAAMVLIDAIGRQLPGVLGDADSALQDSFMTGLLDCPHYTRPEVYDGQTVPAVLLGGDHQKIAQWRHQQALLRTAQRRPDVLSAQWPSLSANDRAWLSKNAPDIAWLEVLAVNGTNVKD
ncbi:MAG: tRNA (guanosine(37)-N1)-methyltransferase TrmD [Gammaproteobacteria bacterium]|nr:tRNA (guanosine(37)-N1)-methyltransferase TrmD [Gammaproteobacteria bacterium]